MLIAAPTLTARAELAAMLKDRASVDVAVATPGIALAGQIAERRPDVLVLAVDAGSLDAGSRDATNPGARGVDATLRALTGAPRPPAVVILTDDLRAVWSRHGRRVSAVLPRDATADELLAAIDGAVAGLIVLHPDAAGITRDGERRRHASVAERTTAAPLTAREREVLDMMAAGLGNKAIAARLGISTHTVKFHVAAILVKLDAGSRTEAVTRAVQRGLVLV